MTAPLLERPRLPTAAELPDATDGRYELQEGKVVESPSPVPEHQFCQHRLQVQLDPQVSRPTLTACHLAGEFGYADATPVSGTFTAEAPSPVRLDLDHLG